VLVGRRQKSKVNIDLEVEEGEKYYFGDIRWVGNTIYPSDYLNNILGIKKGDVFNQKILDKRHFDNDEGLNKFYTILEYKYESAENLIRLLRKGLVGASYNFYDVHRGVGDTKHFDVDNVFQNLIAQNLLGGSNTKYSYAPDYKIKDKKLSNYDSKVITKISSTGAYRGNNDAIFRSYSDETLGGDHIKHVNSKAIKGFLSKAPLLIKVKGREFLTGDNNHTLGKTIRVIFLDTDNSDAQAGPSKDLKKSGDYLIIGANHMFTNDTIVSELILGKVASLGKEIAI
jgi:hypothetical protein